jgi:nucleotide-binding universal stress UspA family protein
VVEALTAEALEGCGHTATQLFGRQPRLTATYEALRAELVRRGIDAELHVAEGDPERLIPDLADKLGAELVVLGSSQRPARTSHVTLGVLRRLPCSALVAASSYVSLRPDPSDPSKPS